MSGFHPYQAVLRQQLEERQGSVELVLLEAAWNDEMQCEAGHSDFRNRECSGSVTHLDLSDCGIGRAPAHVCEKQARWVEYWRATDIECAECGNPCSNHWKVRPI